MRFLLAFTAAAAAPAGSGISSSIIIGAAVDVGVLLSSSKRGLPLPLSVARGDVCKSHAAPRRVGCTYAARTLPLPLLPSPRRWRLPVVTRHATCMTSHVQRARAAAWRRRGRGRGARRARGWAKRALPACLSRRCTAIMWAGHGHASSTPRRCVAPRPAQVLGAHLKWTAFGALFLSTRSSHPWALAPCHTRRAAAAATAS